MSQEQDPGAIPGHSTNSIYPRRGGIRIDWLVKVEGDCPDVSTVIANKTINANDNFANEDFALAA